TPGPAAEATRERSVLGPSPDGEQAAVVQPGRVDVERVDLLVQPVGEGLVALADAHPDACHAPDPMGLQASCRASLAPWPGMRRSRASCSPCPSPWAWLPRVRSCGGGLCATTPAPSTRPRRRSAAVGSWRSADRDLLTPTVRPSGCPLRQER